MREVCAVGSLTANENGEGTDKFEIRRTVWEARMKIQQFLFKWGLQIFAVMVLVGILMYSFLYVR